MDYNKTCAHGIFNSMESFWSSASCTCTPMQELSQTIELGVRNHRRALIVCRDNVSQSRVYGVIAMYSPVGTMYLQGW